MKLIPKHQNKSPITRTFQPWEQDYYDGTGWRFVEGRYVNQSDPNYSTVQRKGLDKKYLVGKDNMLIPERTRLEYQQNKEYQAQLPYQAQNDIQDERQIQKQQADRFVGFRIQCRKSVIYNGY